MQVTKCMTTSFNLHCSPMRWICYRNVLGGEPDAGRDK